MGEYEIKNPQEVMIKLLGRIAYTPDKIREIVVGKKQKKTEWVKAYNLCDGEHEQQRDIAKEAGIDEGDFSRAIKEWERVGIIFQVKNKKGKECSMAITYLDEKEE